MFSYNSLYRSYIIHVWRGIDSVFCNNMKNITISKINQLKRIDNYERNKSVKKWEVRFTICQMFFDLCYRNRSMLVWLVLFIFFFINLLNGNIDFALQSILPILNNVNK